MSKPIDDILRMIHENDDINDKAVWPNCCQKALI